MSQKPTYNLNFMISKIVNISIGILLIMWGIGFFVYDYAYAIHFLLLAALGLFIMKVMIEK